MHGDALTEWIRAEGLPFSAGDPVDVPGTSLEPLQGLIGSARVIALGESMHRTHEFLAWRQRILRFLVENAGFTALVIESGFPESAVVDDWVTTGRGRLREALDDGITYHFGKCQEALDLVTWMRQHNSRAVSPVRFYGMDIPDSASSALPAIVDVVDFLALADPAYADHVRRTLLAAHAFLPSDRSGFARAAPAIQSYLALPTSERHAITAAINGLVERVRARQTDFADEGIAPETAARALRSAEVARGADAFLAAMSEGPTRTWPAANIRDATMADTVQWILEREERVLLFAANGHVRKTPYLAPPFVAQPLATVGTHLRSRLGADYLAIGTTFGGGEAWLHRPRADDLPGHSTPFTEPIGALRPDSLDHLLAEAAPGSFLVDLRTAPPDAAARLDTAAGTHNGRELELGDVRASFDLVLHVDEVSPWHTWIDDRGHW